MKMSFKLTHWGRVTHICVSELTIIGSDNGLPPGRCQAIIWTIAGILLIRTLVTNFSEAFSEVHTFSFRKMHLKMSSAKWRPFCLGLHVPVSCGSTPAVRLRIIHDDVMAWEHFSCYLPFVTGIHRLPMVSPYKGPVTRNLKVLFEVRLNKQLDKHVSRRWFETPWC